MPAIQASRSEARKTSCTNNLKQIGSAFANYQLARKVFPPSCTDSLKDVQSFIEMTPDETMHSWATLILNYIEQAQLFDTMDLKVHSLLEPNMLAGTTIIPIYRCPEYQGAEFVRSRKNDLPNRDCAIGNYAAMGSTTVGNIWGADIDPDAAIIPGGNIGPHDITDGLSHTVFIVERRDEKAPSIWIDGMTAGVTALPWGGGDGYPEFALKDQVALNYTPYYIDGLNKRRSALYGPSSMHPGGAYHLFGDGSVRFIKDEVQPAIYVAITTRAGDDVVDDVN
jgi:hypothetical protein